MTSEKKEPPHLKYTWNKSLLESLLQENHLTHDQYHTYLHQISKKYNHIEEHAPLRDFLLSPQASTEKIDTEPEKNKVPLLDLEEIYKMMSEGVPGVEDMMDRTGTVPVTTYLVGTYKNGLPLFQTNPGVQSHTVHALRWILWKVKGMSEKTRKFVLKRLAEAYTSCQMEQGRVIDSLYGSLTGRDKTLKDQILALVDIQKDQVLNQLVNHFNPNAWKTSDDNPHGQVPHIQSSYCAAIGHKIGLRGANSSILDNYCSPIPPQKAEQLEAEFRKKFSILDLVNSIVSDVNQQEKEVERMISQEALTKWASCPEENGGFHSHSIYYDEENPGGYIGGPKEENKYQPFLNRVVTLDLLLHLFQIKEGFGKNVT